MKKIKLKVFGVQDYGEFSDCVSMAYFGTFSDDGELVVEYTQKAENKSVLNKIEVDKNLKKAKIIKDNREKNAVVVEKNKTNLCNYLTDFGVNPLEIFGKEIDVKIEENG